MVKLLDLVESDETKIFRLTNYKTVMQWIGNGKIWSREKVRKLIQSQISDKQDDSRKYFYYKITEEEDTIGLIGVHPFDKFPGYYLTVLIKPSEQGKGYYKQSIKKLKPKLLKDGFQGDEVNILVRASNKKMNKLSQKNYYFEKKLDFRGESFNLYVMFFRPMTYLVKTEVLNKDLVDNLMKKMGNWEKWKGG